MLLHAVLYCGARTPYRTVDKTVDNTVGNAVDNAVNGAVDNTVDTCFVNICSETKGADYSVRHTKKNLGLLG